MTDGNNIYPRWLSISGEELDLDLPSGLLGKCRSIRDYKKHYRLGEGTYGVVYRASDLTTPAPHTVVALKQMRLSDRDRSNGMPITSIREIALLKSLRHPNIISLVDVAVGKDMADVYMVMEYAEQDMAHLLDDLRVKFTLSEVKSLMKQLLEGVEYIHRHDILHRDIKMSNLLYTNKGLLKVADFGMARPYSARPLTPDVVTLWYRPPEVLLGCVRYSKASDIWSTGLVLGELILLTPLLAGSTELEQISLICKMLGPPTDESWPKMRLLPRFTGHLLRMPDDGSSGSFILDNRFRDHTLETVNILKDILQWDPERRPSAKKLLEHRWFRSEEPRAKDPLMMPTYPEVNRGEGIGENFDIVEEEERGPAVATRADYESGGRSAKGGDWGGKSRVYAGGGGGGIGIGSSRGAYGDISEGGGAAATMAEKVAKRGAEQVGRGGAGGYLFDFGNDVYGDLRGEYNTQGGGRYSKKSRH